jgi:hypothetical protein
VEAEAPRALGGRLAGGSHWASPTHGTFPSFVSDFYYDRVDGYGRLESFRRIKLASEPQRHTAEFRNVCERCGKSYKWHYTLCRHMKYECGKPASFCCTFCTYRAKRKDNLNYHVAHCHVAKSEKPPDLSDLSDFSHYLDC